MRISTNITQMSSPTQIQYTIITDEISFSDTPFCVWALNIIRTLPIDIMQLEDTLWYYELSNKAHLNKTFELFSLDSSILKNRRKNNKTFFESYSNSFNKSIIYVFIIDASIESHKELSELIQDLNHGYFSLSQPIEDSPYDVNYQFQNPIELIEFFKRDFKLINNSISEYYGDNKNQLKELLISPSKSFLSENFDLGNTISTNNYYMLNQIIGKNWLESDNTSITKVKTKKVKRIVELIESSRKLDFLYYTLKSKFNLKQVLANEPFFTTLVLIAPYHFPAKIKEKKSKKDILYTQFLSQEQDLNYNYHSHIDFSKEFTDDEIDALEQNLILKSIFLDCAAFLHSRFTYSSTIKLPHIGKSLNLNLSHINKGFSSDKKETKKIESIGENLKKHLFDNLLIEYINNRNCQIFCISDLPIEWSKLDKLPLCYSHDVCRMPEFNTNAIINSAIHFQRLTYTIPQNIIDNTLIIHCASEEDKIMQKMFAFIDEFTSDFSVKTEHCSTIVEVKLAIDKHQPELLIFDCHGGINKDTLSSYLVLDAKNKIFLTGDDIVKHSITAPLVFLSACNTMPNYGYVKFLSDAFMQAGSYSVTTTFLPIQIMDASVLIIRLISKLNQLKTDTYHCNWLEFVSHVLRTTLIHESIRKAQSKSENIEIDHHIIASILAKTMFFDKRLEAFSELESLLKERFNLKNIDLSSISNDWMSYSIIGRADLLYFENWIEKFRLTNTSYTK